MRENVQVYIYAVHEERLLMLKRTPERSGYWQPVCGGIECGESAEEAALREVEEEIGLVIENKIKRLPFKYTYKANKGGFDMDMKDLCYLYEIPSIETICLSDEHEDHVWCLLDDIPQLSDWKPILEVCDYIKSL